LRSRHNDAYEKTLARFLPDETGCGGENLQPACAARSDGDLEQVQSSAADDRQTKSEIAVGYARSMATCAAACGDQRRAKTMVWEMSPLDHRFEGREIHSEKQHRKSPSAELRSNQTDQDSLPRMKCSMRSCIGMSKRKGAGEIMARVSTLRRFTRDQLIDRSEYKRRQRRGD